MGSGSTIAACEAVGIASIGAERYQDYYELSRKAIPLLAMVSVEVTESFEF